MFVQRPAPLSVPALDNAPVYLDSLLRAPTTGQGGFAPYTSQAVILGRKRFERSLLTHVSGAGWGGQTSNLVVRLDGAYTQFVATLGRDASAMSGVAPVRFEVWGDNKMLFRSAPVVIGVSLEAAVVVGQVRELRLVTRYAGTPPTPKTPERAATAKGCVWGDARLLSAGASAASMVPKPSGSVKPAKPLPQPAMPAPVGKSAPIATNPGRDALRYASAQLVLGTLLWARSAKKSFPLRCVIAPLQTGRDRDREQAGEQVRAWLAELLATGRTSEGETVFVMLDSRAMRDTASALPANRPARSQTDEANARTKAARRVRADVLVTGAVAPVPPGTESETGGIDGSGWGWQIGVYEAQSGAVICETFVPATFPAQK